MSPSFPYRANTTTVSQQYRPTQGTASSNALPRSARAGAGAAGAGAAGDDRQGRGDVEEPWAAAEAPGQKEDVGLQPMGKGTDSALGWAKLAGRSMKWYAPGAPEVILESCDRFLTDEGAAPLDAAGRQQVLSQAQTMAGEALRNLRIAAMVQTLRAANDWQRLL